MRKIIVWLLIIFLLMCLCINEFSLTKATDKVNVVPDDYSTITDALINSQNGDTIFVKNGVYRESQLNINRSITIIGEDANNTKIINTDKLEWDPTLNPFPPPAPKVMQIAADNVVISGLTFSFDYGGGYL